MKIIFSLLLVLLCGVTLAIVESQAAKSDCINIVGPGWLPVKKVVDEQIQIRNDYDTVVEEDQRDIVTYLSFIGGSQPIPNACGLNPKNPRSHWTGWGGPIDTDNATIGEGIGSRSEIVIGGVYFERGIATHAPGTLVYDLTGGDYLYFEGYLGISDQTDGFWHTGGEVIFIFYIDDEEVYRSERLSGNEDAPSWQNISPVKVEFDIPIDAGELKIVFDDYGDEDFDHAVIGDAKLLSEHPIDLGVTPTDDPTTTTSVTYADADRRVKIIYFLPKDRPFQEYIPSAMDARIKEVQSFFAQQMDEYGYGMKTFPIETDANGNAIVYNVTGRFNDEYYHSDTLVKVEMELKSQFDLEKDVYLVVTDVSTDNIDGSCGIAHLDGGPALVPASGRCVSGNNGITLIAHELGHAFNLKHDFRNNFFIMSYGSDPIKFSPCAAAALNVNPFFNQDNDLSGISNTKGVIQMLSESVYPETQNGWKPKFEVTDLDSIYQIQFLIPRYVVEPAAAIADDSLFVCETLNGSSTSTIVEFDVPELFYTFDANQIGVRVFDPNGFVSELYWVLLSDRIVQSVDPLEDGAFLTLSYETPDSLVPTNNFREWAGWIGLTWEKTPDGFYPPQPEEYISTPYVDRWNHWFYSHAPSRLDYDISSGTYSTFVAYFHMPASCEGIASMEVIFEADNVEIYGSGVLSADEAQNKKISVDLPENTKTFSLIIRDDGDNSCDHFIIANATLVYGEPTEPPITEPPLTVIEVYERNADVIKDGVVNLVDLVLVVVRYGEKIVGDPFPNPDVNRDGIVDILDLILVAQYLPPVVGAPRAIATPYVILENADWQYAYTVLPDTVVDEGIAVLERLFGPVAPTRSLLLKNYPNPFNPETWLPYQLSKASDITITIYNMRGVVVRQLALGHQKAGFYTSRRRAAHWDGCNTIGEKVAAGVYFYTFKAGDFTSHAQDVDTKIVSNDHRIAGMLMFISFATIVDEWVKLESLPFSLRNDAVSDKRV